MASQASLSSRNTGLLDTFRVKLQEEWTHRAKPACYQECEPECSCERRFVDVDDMLDWMRLCDSGDSAQSNERTPNAARLLDELHDKTKNHRQFPFPVDFRSILEGEEACLLVFAILLEQDCGELIELFQDAGINDKSLYHSIGNEEKQYLIERRAPLEVIRNFERLKWDYLPPRLTFQMKNRFEGYDIVMPFCRRKPVNDKGGTAMVYHVSVKQKLIDDPELRAVLAKSLYNDPDHGPCYQMALKTYSKDMRSVYDAEREAFAGLGSEDCVPIVRYLGCYSHNDSLAGEDSRTYNILLEYGQMDLEEYCADLENIGPVTSMEIIRFWESIFKVAHAINKIHNVCIEYRGRTRDYDGWHGDVKPDNILNVHGEFKLADFGFARFSERATTDIPTHNIHGGTDTYGAPELARMRHTGTLTPVMQTIDTWSFGCVLSVTATWIVLGFQGIRQYRVLRRIASSDRKNSSKVTDRFHNGVRLLPEIKHWHNFLRNHIRESDILTKKVLDLIESKMLRSDPRDRLPSKQLCDELVEIIRHAKNDMELRKRYLKPIDNTVRQALLVIDESAGYTTVETPKAAGIPPLQSHIFQVDFAEPGDVASTLYIPVDHIPVDSSSDRIPKRAGKDAKLQKTPLARTPHRKEILEEELKGSHMLLTVKKHIDPMQGHQTHGGAHTDSPKHEDSKGLSSETESSWRSPGDPNGRRASAIRSKMVLPYNAPSQDHSLRPHTPIMGLQALQTPFIPSDGAHSKQVVRQDDAMFNTLAHHHPGVLTYVDEPSIVEPDSISRPLNSVMNPRVSRQFGHSSPESLPPAVPPTTNSEKEVHAYEYRKMDEQNRGYAIPSNTTNESRPNVYELSPTFPNDLNLHMSNGTSKGVIPGHISHHANAEPPFLANPHWHSSAYPSHSIYHQQLTETPPYAATAFQFPHTTFRGPTPSLIHVPSHVYDLEFDVCRVRQTLELQQPRRDRDWLSFIQNRKKETKDKYLMNYINKRDIIFIIDNGTTMSSHWPIVMFVAQTLAMKVAPLDDDGIDVKFTIGLGSDKNNLRGLSGLNELKNALRHNAPREIDKGNDRDRNPTDMASTLWKLFNAYLAKGQCKATTVLVFTDAKWEGTKPADRINTVIRQFAHEVENYNKKRFDPRHFTIGFIQFGEGRAEQEKLEYLDDELCKTHNPPLNDIIDACTWTDDVNKMLLGSLLDWKDAESSTPASPPLPTSPIPSSSVPSPQTQPPITHSPTLSKIHYDPNDLAHLFNAYNNGLQEAVVPHAGSSTTNGSAHPHLVKIGSPKRSDTINTFLSSSEKKVRMSFIDKLKDMGSHS